MDEAPSFSGAVFGDGGWTLVARSHPDATAGDFGWFIPYGSPRNDADKYSL